mmetsp:Transcript_2591/g.7257  ORF Transcript_2591/g.7257 Transcript_2591/m.7257 type:complete len:209 (-) Transcript_2591:1128-1754(-)
MYTDRLAVGQTRTNCVDSADIVRQPCTLRLAGERVRRCRVHDLKLAGNEVVVRDLVPNDRSTCDACRYIPQQHHLSGCRACRGSQIRLPRHLGTDHGKRGSKRRRQPCAVHASHLEVPSLTSRNGLRVSGGLVVRHVQLHQGGLTTPHLVGYVRQLITASLKDVGRRVIICVGIPTEFDIACHWRVGVPAKVPRSDGWVQREPPRSLR